MKKTGKRVLMLDDEMHTVEAIGLALSDVGYLVKEATSVQEALEVLADGTPLALLILDVMMPPGPIDPAKAGDGFRTGIEVATLAWQRRSELPILVLTNIDDPEVDAFFRSEKRCRIFKKYALRPRNVAREVEQFLRAVNETESSLS